MRLLTISRLDLRESYKQIDLLVSVIQELEGMSLLVIGAGSALESLIALRGTCQRIQFFGAVARPQYFLEHTDCFVLPSTKEGFGLVFLEAMLAGKPCIGWRAGATPEVVVHGVTGLLVASRTELAGAICWMASHQSERDAMGRAGLMRAHNVFSRTRFTDRVKELLG